MDKKVFKNLFDEIAQKNGFERAFSVWFKEQDESMVVVDLQRSNYSHFYYVNINVYIQGFWGRTFKKGKDFNFGDGGAALSTRSPKEYDLALDLENKINDQGRKELLEKMFTDFLLPFTKRTSTRSGIIEMYENDNYPLLPAVKKELGIKFD